MAYIVTAVLTIAYLVLVYIVMAGLKMVDRVMALCAKAVLIVVRRCEIANCLLTKQLCGLRCTPSINDMYTGADTSLFY